MIVVALCRRASVRQGGLLSKSVYRKATELSFSKRPIYRNVNGTRNISSLLENTRNIGIIAHVDAVRLAGCSCHADFAANLLTV